METSVNIVLYKWKTLKDDTNPLMLRIIKNCKASYKSIGVSVNQNDWDFNTNKPKPTCPNGAFIQPSNPFFSKNFKFNN